MSFCSSAEVMFWYRSKTRAFSSAFVMSIDTSRPSAFPTLINVILCAIANDGSRW